MEVIGFGLCVFFSLKNNCIIFTFCDIFPFFFFLSLRVLDSVAIVLNPNNFK